MSKARQSTQQAIDLIQVALSEWEGRVAELESDLSKKPESADQIYAELESLRGRFQESEKSREKWKVEAGELEVMLEHKQAQIDGLKDKLRIAESGPDKSGKKEINFWRQKIEKFEAQAAQHREHMSALQSELAEKSQVADSEYIVSIIITGYQIYSTQFPIF